jgi:SAM-dependent methyltransferase
MPSSLPRSGSSTHLSYGLDTPGPVLFILFASLIMGLAGFIALKIETQYQLMGFLGVAALLFALLLIAVGTWMFWSAYRGKALAAADFINQLDLKSNQKLLDVGCGRGFILIEAAKRLPRGKATGLDDWSQFDLYVNNPGKTWENAQIEGVSARVKVDTGDMRKLPYPKHSFDRVTAHLALHRLNKREDRKTALMEMARVLKPKGLLALQDFKNLRQTVVDLKTLQFKNIQLSKYKFFFFPPVRMILAQK